MTKPRKQSYRETFNDVGSPAAGCFGLHYEKWEVSCPLYSPKELLWKKDNAVYWLFKPDMLLVFVCCPEIFMIIVVWQNRDQLKSVLMSFFRRRESGQEISAL